MAKSACKCLDLPGGSTKGGNTAGERERERERERE